MTFTTKGNVMRTDPNKFFQMRVSEEFLAKLDDVRSQYRPLPTRAELVRMLIEEKYREKRTIHEKVNKGRQ